MGELLDAGRKPQTVASYRRVLLLAVADAERDGLVPRNVVRLSRPPRTSDQPPRALSANNELGSWQLPRMTRTARSSCSA